MKPGTQRLWVRRFHKADNARIRLVCFPHAGGSASYFFRLSAALTPEFDVIAIQYPGRQDRHGEPFVETIDDLADHIFAVLNPMIDGPIALFGHSMGSLVAFEVARRFEESAGIKPTTVFVSAMRAPSRFGDEKTQVDDDAGFPRQTVSNWRNKAIERQYHTFFQWDGRHANQFFGLFGESFKQRMKEVVDADPELRQSIRDFLDLGNARNTLVHGNYAEAPMDKSARDVLSQYHSACVFVRQLEASFGACAS